MSAHKTSTLSNGDKEYIRNNKDVLKELPEPGETFAMKEMPKGIQKNARECKNRSIIVKKKRCKLEASTAVDGDRSYWAWLWETNPKAHEYIEHYLSVANPFLPCGHSGLRNLGDDEFTCNYEYCDKVYTREEVKR